MLSKVVGIGAFLVYGCLFFESSAARDFYQFWIVGHAIAELDVSNIYSIEERTRVGRYYFDRRLQVSPRFGRDSYHRRMLDPAGTPALYATFFLLSTGDYDADYTIFRLASWIAFVLAVVSLGAVLNFGPVATLGILVALTSFSAGFQGDVSGGNVNQIQFAFVALQSWLASRLEPTAAAVRGWLWGFMCFFKPTVLPGLVLLVAARLIDRGHRREVAPEALGLALGAAFAFVVPIVLFGPACSWSEWFRFFQFWNNRSTYIDNTFTALFFETRTRAVFVGIGATLTAVVLPAIWRGRGCGCEDAWRNPAVRARDELFLVAFGLAIYVLAGTMVHLHYVLLLYPLLFIAVRPAPDDSAGRRFVEPRQVVGMLAIVHLSALTVLPSTPDIVAFRLNMFRYGFVLFILVLGDFYRLRAGQHAADARA